MMEKKDRHSSGGGGGRQRQMNEQPRSKQPGSGSNYDNGGNRNSSNNNNNKDKGKNKGGGGKVADPRTLFVKFHPPSATVTRQHLSDHFSNYGPVNRCSVIRNQKKRTQPSSGGAGDNHDGEDNDGGGDNNGGKEDRGSRGFGFVRFVNEEDARAAADSIRTKNNARGGGGGGEIMVVDGERYAIRAERAADANMAAEPPMRRGKEETGRASAKVVPSSSSNETNATGGSSLPSPSPKVVAATTRGPADATTRKDTKDDADAIYKAESKRKRTSRVIIRNLSFHATERHVRSAMEASFGPVASIDLPTVPVLPSEDDDNRKDDRGGKGKQRRPPVLPRHRGFAFVTFASAADARKAVAGSSGEGGAEVKIKNRPVAIDFSVSKMEHRRIAKEGEEKGEEEEKSDSESVAEEEEVEGGEGNDEDHDDDGSDSDSDGDDDDDDDEEEDDGEEKSEAEDVEDDGATAAPAREHDPTEARRTLFLRNVPFDATRHDVFDLFRKFGRVEAAYLVKERETGVFRGTAFVRFETEGACASAMAAASSSEGGDYEGGGGQFVSGKNIAMGLGAGGGGGDPSSSSSSSGLLLKGRAILVDLAVDRTTASSLAVRRDDDGKPIKKMVGKDKRNLYLKNEGRVSSAAESADAREASARHGGTWEDLPPGDRAKRERAFADKSTKLRSPLFFINPHRISIRNLAKHVDEAGLKKLVFGALKEGLKEGLATPKDAVAHWRAGGELAHSEVMRRATDPSLVTPPLDEKNMRGSVASVFIDRDYSGGKKAADAPSRGFGFVEFAHHTHALAALRQLNNNPAYSAEYAAGGKHASEMAKQRGGKKGKKAKVDPETGLEFLNEDGKASVPRLIVELAVSYLS